MPERNMSCPVLTSVSLLIMIVDMVTLSSTSIEGISSSSSTPSFPNFNFAAVGGWACTSDIQDTVNNILGKSPELVLRLGDYVYGEDSADCWFDIIQPIDKIMKIAIGNHEIEEWKSILTQYMSL